MMKIKKEYIILAAIILILSLYLLKQQKGNMHYSLPELKKIDKKDITKIIIKKAGSEITMLKKNDKWLIAPQDFPANNDLVKKMEDEISSLTVTDLVSESKNGILYDLNEEKMTGVEVYKGNEMIRKVEIGKLASSYRHTFVKIEKDSRIFHAQGDLTNTFNKTLSGLRDKAVLVFRYEEITGISMSKGGKKLSINKGMEKKDTASPKWITDKGEPVKEQEMESIIKVLSNLLCDDFIEGKTKNDFKNPVFTISLKGDKEYSLALFEKTDKNYPAIASGTEYPFYISEFHAESFMKDFEKLKENKKAEK